VDERQLKLIPESSVFVYLSDPQMLLQIRVPTEGAALSGLQVAGKDVCRICLST